MSDVEGPDDYDDLDQEATLDDEGMGPDEEEEE